MWCADIQGTSGELLYVDRIQYMDPRGLSERLAAGIVDAIRERRLLA